MLASSLIIVAVLPVLVLVYTCLWMCIAHWYAVSSRRNMNWCKPNANGVDKSPRSCPRVLFFNGDRNTSRYTDQDRNEAMNHSSKDNCVHFWFTWGFFVVAQCTRSAYAGGSFLFHFMSADGVWAMQTLLLVTGRWLLLSSMPQRRIVWFDPILTLLVVKRHAIQEID